MNLSPNCPNRFSGMTLLEILIALSLMVVLLGFVWGMVTLFSTDYLAGEKRAGRAQLVRSISQMLSDDLGAAVQDPVHPVPSSNNETVFVRRFGLHGDGTSLQIDVIEPNLLVESATLAENRAAAASSSKPARPQVPELKTVFYEFVPPNTLRNGGSRRDSSGRSQTQIELARKYGLSRKELSYEAPDPAAAEEGSRQNAPFSAQQAAARPEPEPFLSAAQLAMEIDDGTAWMPEVVDCCFRYYDGKNWLASWDSIKKNGLPTAIEVRLKLLPLDDVETLRTSPFLYRLAYPPNRFDLNTAARGGNGAVTLESAAETLSLSPVMTREIVVSLPITPLAMHKTLGRRKPLPAVKGEAGRRSAGGAESSAAASGDWIGGRAFTGQGDLFPTSGPGGEGESLGSLVTPGQAAPPSSPFDRIDSLVSGFEPSSGTGFDGMVSAPAGTPVPSETVRSSAETKPGVQQQWLRGRR